MLNAGLDYLLPLFANGSFRVKMLSPKREIEPLETLAALKKDVSIYIWFYGIKQGKRITLF